jgi:drug/metabolite transporter (DMT)-like permease
MTVNSTRGGLVRGKLAPSFFVILWSTGFIGAKLGLPYVGPMTFLALRFALVAAFMTPVALLSGTVWPQDAKTIGHVALVGILMQFLFLGGVFVGIAHGVPAGTSALIVGIQPLLTAALAALALGERVRPRQWAGLGLGLLGVLLVVANPAMLEPERLRGAGFTVLALMGITIGTLYQKRYAVGVDLRVTVFIQNFAAAVAMTAAALVFEQHTVQWDPHFLFALGWLVLVVSIGASTLLFYLIRHGAASSVSSLFYLTPGVTALFAFVLFGEASSVAAFVGMGIAAAGVGAVNSG